VFTERENKVVPQLVSVQPRRSPVRLKRARAIPLEEFSTIGLVIKFKVPTKALRSGYEYGRRLVRVKFDIVRSIDTRLPTLHEGLQVIERLASLKLVLYMY